LLRHLQTVEAARGRTIALAPSELVSFSSNDYLGLSQHPALKEAAIKAIERYGVGAGASRLLGGGYSPHRELEELLAAFKGAEAALSFSSGYAAALGALPALVGPNDVIIIDKLSHACLVDAARLSRAHLRVYPHNHLGKLESHLEWARENHPNATVLIVTEAVFSMDGDTAPLKQIVDLKRRFGAALMLDEAHATGVVGEQGRGLAHLAGVVNDIDVRMGTLSKAVGASGGFIVGGHELIEYMVNRARSFIFSTAPAPATAAAAVAAVRIMMSDAGESLRQRLWERVHEFAKLVPGRFRVQKDGSPESAIFALHIGDERRATQASSFLQRRGLLIPAVRYPTVALKSARLRAAVTAAHEPAQIHQAGAALHALVERMVDVIGEPHGQ
jgi:glycine C-acetyltransferase/8-amino-7-oxononanoate synthase